MEREETVTLLYMTAFWAAILMCHCFYCVMVPI